MKGVPLFWGCFLPFVLASQCPDPDFNEWAIKDNECQKQHPTYRYHCQTDAEKDISTPLCAPAINCTPGTRAKIDTIKKTVTCVPCSSRMYQPSGRISYRFVQPNCDRHVRPCDEGELQCEGPSTTQNYLCRCNHTQGMRPNIHHCGCFDKSLNPDCQCIKADCKEDEVLSSDYSCVPAIIVTSSSTPGTVTKTHSDNTSLIIGLVVPAVVIIGVITILVYCLYRKKKKKKTTSASSNSSDVERGLLDKPPETTQNSIPALAGSSEATRDNTSPVKSHEDKRDGRKDDSELYNRTKAMFVDSVNPHSILVRLDLGLSDEEKLAEFIERHGRERGAQELLKTVRRTRPDDWFECIIQSMKDPNVQLTHIAVKMERIRDDLKGARNKEECKHDHGNCEDCTKTPQQESTQNTQSFNEESGTPLNQDGPGTIVCQADIGPTSVDQADSSDHPTQTEICRDGTNSDSTLKKESYDDDQTLKIELVTIPKKRMQGGSNDRLKEREISADRTTSDSTEKKYYDDDQTFKKELQC